MEAVKKLQWNNLNPFLATFGVGFLNDHWHPILAIVKIPALIFSLSTSMFLTEIVFSLATAFVPLIFIGRGLTRWSASLLTIYLLINRHIMEATIAVPVHPAVWANFLLLSACAIFIFRKSEKSKWPDVAIVALVFATSFFGEQFSLAALGLGLFYFFCGSNKHVGGAALLLGLFVVWFTLSGRELLIGPILHQTARVSFNPYSVIKKYNWDFSQAKNVLVFLLEALPLFYVAFRSRKSGAIPYRNLLFTGGVFGPLVLGRLLSNSFGQQYSPLLVVAIAAVAMIFLEGVEVRPKAVTTAFFVFLLFSYSKFERSFVVMSGTRLQNCVDATNARVINSIRLPALTKALNKIAEDSIKKSIEVVALGNLVPNLVESIKGGNVRNLQLAPLPMISRVDWIVIEHGLCGDPWPWGKEAVERYISALSRMPDLTIRENSPCLFVAQGPMAGAHLPAQ